MTRRSGVRYLVAIALAGWLAACAGAQRLPTGPPPQPQPGPDCLATCTKQYKDCAYGSECMMVAECDMEVCIPQRQSCEAHCAGAK